jgi:hypothetical protein
MNSSAFITAGLGSVVGSVLTIVLTPPLQHYFLETPTEGCPKTQGY